MRFPDVQNEENASENINEYKKMTLHPKTSSVVLLARENYLKKEIR